MPAPLVSVLLPVYDSQTTLPGALASIERQSLRDFECVLVDDGSRDDSGEIARAAARRDARFRVVTRPHTGLVGALNAGLRECRGAFIARTDADDLMHRDRLRAQVEALEKSPSAAGVGCHVRLFPRTALRDGLRAYEAWLRSVRSADDVARELFIESPAVHPTWCLRREPFLALGYRDAGWPEDYDFLQRLHLAGHQFGMVPHRLVSWREHPGRLTHRGAAYRIEQFPRLKAAFLCEGFLSGTKSYVLWGYGHTGRALRRALLEHGRTPSRIVEVHPGRLGQRIHGAPVIPPEELAQHRNEPIVASVAGAGPRSEVRRALDRMGFAESRDFVCAA